MGNDEKGCECCACYEKTETLLKVHDASHLSTDAKRNRSTLENLRLFDEITKHNLQYRAHVVCDKCFFDWFILQKKKECPLCRQKVEKNQIVELVENLGEERLNEMLVLQELPARRAADEKIKDLLRKK